MHKRTIQRIHQDTYDTSFGSDLHPVLKRIYSHRGIRTEDDINYGLDRLLPLQGLKGLETAVDILKTAVEQNQKILIVGDFDADGATSSALSIRALNMLGASRVAYLVPNRFDFGYGLTPELVAIAVEDKPDVLITVDNGISCLEGVTAAKAAGIKVVVTDHHLAGEQLPEADAIVNPNQPECDFTSKALAGVGVVFYVMLALRAALRENGWFDDHRKQPNMGRLLDLVALGTVADVVPLDRNNRILVHQGLKRIQLGQSCPGIRALLEIAGREPAHIVASDLGFAVAPRLNAAGRLEDMSLGIECLLTDDINEARDIARQLDDLNHSRRAIEQEMQHQAMLSITPLIESLGHEQLPKGLCLYDDSWHQGVIGILASRIKERFNRPVIAFADAGDGEIKGSARSIKGLHIRDLLESIATRHPSMIIKFGGHAMAAGLSIKLSRFEEFKSAFEQQAAMELDEAALEGIIESDGELSTDEISLELAQSLRDAGPWGQHFPEPLFDGEFEVDNWRVVGEKHLKMQLRTEDSDQLIDAIAFNANADQLEQTEGFIRAAYRLDVNRFRNQTTAQLIIDYFEGLE